MFCNPGIPVRAHLRLVIISIVATLTLPALAMKAIPDAGSSPPDRSCVSDRTRGSHSPKCGAGLVNPVSWASFTHNPIVLAIRFHGTKGPLRKQLLIGKLAVNDVGKHAKIKIAGTQRIDGETLPYVSIIYPTKGEGNANVELAGVLGPVIKLSLQCALRTPGQVKRKLVSEYLEPGKLILQTGKINGTETTSFGDGVPFTVENANISNSAAFKVKRSTLALPFVPMGGLNTTANNLVFDHFNFTFEGEDNALTLSGDARMPDKTAWIYEMPDDRFIWTSGQVAVSGLALTSSPQHSINLGGIAIGLDHFKIDSTVVTMDDSSLNAVPKATFNGIEIAASDLSYKNSTLTGSLKKPISIKEMSGQLQIQNIFEGLELPEQQVKNLQIGLANLAYKSDSGLSVNGRSLDISVNSYTSHTNADGTSSTNVDASINLQDAPIAQQDNGTFHVNQFTASLGGSVDKLSGHGQIDGTLSGAKAQLGIDMSKLFGHCSPDNKLHLDVAQLGSAWVKGDINILNGDPSGTVTVPLVGFTLSPEYWRCDYDDGDIGFNLPGIHVGWDGIWLTSDGPHVSVGTVHWEAKFDPLVGGVGGLALAEIRFDNSGAKICGGHTFAAFELWTPAFGPNFNDCGAWWCNIPRDIVSGVEELYEAPAGQFLNLAALGAVNTVGLFDAGIFQNKCQ